MNRKLRINILLMVFVTIYSSCKKTDDDAQPVKSRTDLLTANSWIITNVVADAPFDTLVNWSQTPECEKDNYYTFSEDGNGIYNEGPTKCDVTDNQTQNFKWTWMNEEIDLQIIQGTDTMLFEEVVLSAGSMKVRQNWELFYVTTTFSKL